MGSTLNSTVERIEYLDALRGFGAMAVLLGHANESIRTLSRGAGTIPLEGWGLTGVLLDGRAAVALFFVISGYVLTLPWAEGRRRAAWPDVLGYYVGRAVRIYPIFLVAMLLCGLGMWLWPTPAELVPTTLSWRYRLEAEQADLLDWLKQMAIVWPGVTFAANPPGWTMAYEMWCSLLLPAVVLPLVLFAPSLAAAVAAGIVTVVLAFVFGNVLLFHFAMGALIAFYRTPLVAFVQRRRSRWPLFLLGLTLYALSSWVGTELRLEGFGRWREVHSLMAGAGVAAILAGSFGSKGFQKVVLNRFTLWSGRVSYPLYAAHYAWVFGLGAWLIRDSGVEHAGMVWTLMLGGAFLVAEVLTRLVDQPSMQWSRRSNRWVRARMTAPSSS